MENSDQQLEQRLQYAAYLVLSLGAFVFTVVLLPSSDAYFRRFFGEPNPLVVVAVASVVGVAALRVLQRNHRHQ